MSAENALKSLLDSLDELEKASTAELTQLNSLADLDAFRVSWLGKKGRLTEALKVMGKLSKEERPQAGQRANHCLLYTSDAADE